MADINRVGTPMDICDEGLDETQGAIDQRKRQLQVKQRTRSPFMIGSIDDVSLKISQLDRQLQKYTELVCESRASNYSTTSPDDVLATARQRDRYLQRDKENKEVMKFAGYYTLKTSFVPGLSTRARNISKISMNPSKTSSVKNKDTGKPKFVELQQYPGFDKLELTPLPCDIDDIEMLNIVTDASVFLHKKPKYRPEFQRLFYSNMSKAILQDIFWYVFLEKFQPNCAAQPKLFNRIAHNYVKLLIYCKEKLYKETFFKEYPLLMSQAVYVSFCHAFQDSYRQFGEDFKNDLVNLITEWMSGFRLAPRSWASWNFDKLDPPNIKLRDEILPQNNNKKSSPALNLDYLDHLISRHTSHGGSVTSLSQSGSKSSVSWGNRQTVSRNQKNNRSSHINSRLMSPKCQSPTSSADTSCLTDTVSKGQSSSRKPLNNTLQKSTLDTKKLTDVLTPIREATAEGDNVSEKTNRFSRLSSGLMKELDSRHVVESHPACRGPDFIKSSFNVFGQSPLVTHFLNMKNLSSKSGYDVRVQRTELDNLPSLDVPTYRQVIHSSFKNIKDIEHNFQEMYHKNLKESAAFVRQQQRILRQHEKREAQLMMKPKEIKRLSNLIILEQKKDEDSISAGADAAIEAALMAD